VGLSQDRFAALIHVKASTLRNWEQGRRSPSGAAAALLTAIQNDPVHVIAALNAGRRRTGLNPDRAVEHPRPA
jgi:putative transcriptional regulator